MKAVLYLAITVCCFFIFAFQAEAVEYSKDAQEGDFVQVTLQDGSTFQGDLIELSEKRVILETEEGRIVLLRSSVVEILVLPRLGQQVRLTMVDGTTYEGKWAGEDENSVYIEGPQGKVAWLKSQIQRIEVIRIPQVSPQAPPKGEGLVVIAPTVDQLGWFAYGAPIKTFEAMGCEEEARLVQTWFTIASALDILSYLLILASGNESFSPQARMEAALFGGVLSVAADLIRSNQRMKARERAMEIARRHLAGQPTCLRSLSIPMRLP